MACRWVYCASRGTLASASGSNGSSKAAGRSSRWSPRTSLWTPCCAAWKRWSSITTRGPVGRILLTDGSAAPESAPGRPGAASANYQGHLEMPIRAGDGQVLGNLEIFRPEPWQATESEQVLLDSKAKLAAMALEHRDLTNRLSYQAQHDPLTGLPNRALLEDRLRQALTLARRQAKMVAVFYVDLDRFKFINDTLGHHVGDLLLQQVAKRLEDAVRQSDTLARPGGDEFVAVLFGIETVRDAEIVGERIMEA